MNTERKTLFQVRANSYQKERERTKEAGIRESLTFLGSTVVGLIVSVILYYILRGGCGVIIALIGIVLSSLFIVIGVIYTIVSLVRPTKVVTCPRCGTEHRMYKSARKYMCANCWALLLLGKDPGVAPRLSACPYCGLQTAVTDDHGRFICPNCGIVREPTRIEGWAETQACPECNQTVPEGAIYCKSCGSILKSDFSQPVQGDPALAYDRDWEIGKDAVGHFYLSKALLKGIREGIRPGLDIVEVQSLLDGKLRDALISLEEALQDSELRSSVESVLPEVDLTYAALLELKLSSLQALEPEKVVPEGASMKIRAESHIRPRRSIENILGASLESSGSIGKWGENLVDFRLGVGSYVESYERLKTEVARFVTWKEQQKVR